MIRILSENIWNESSGKFEAGSLFIEGGKIHSWEFSRTPSKSKFKTRDFGKNFVLPSGVDLHVHTRDFDESYKETLESASHAAVAGGVATAASMANTRPRLDSIQSLRAFFAKSKNLPVRFVPFAAVSENLEGKTPTDWDKILKLPVAGLSDDGKPIASEPLMKKALMACKKFKKILSVHEEDLEISRRSPLHESESAMRLGIEGSPAESEWRMVERDLRLAAELRSPVHFGHLSSEKSCALLRAARKKGIPFSAELTPHHALLSVEAAEEFPLARLSQFKVCPVIRTEKDRAALSLAVKQGVIDCFASDHAPHAHYEKNALYSEAPHGMIALEFSLPLYNEFRLISGLSWKSFMGAWSARPASLLGLSTGRFLRGFEANFIVFDPLKEQSIRWLRSKSNNSPFEGRKVRGRVIEHWIRGKKIL